MRYKAYPKYKDSGVEWLGDVPEGWDISKLKYLCQITTGNKDTENKVDNGKYPFYVRSQTIERINSYAFNGEAILTAGDGVGVGKVFHYTNGKFDFHQRVYLFYKFKKVNGKFLFEYIKNNFYKVALAGVAKSTVDSLRLPLIQNFMITIPPLKEQTQIVTYLDQKTKKIDTLIEKQQSLIELLKEKRQALISYVVTKGLDDSVLMKESGVEWLGDVPEGWKVLPLKYITTHNDDVLSENTQKDYEFNYVDIGSVSSSLGIIKYEKMIYCNAPSRARRKVKNGDIIVSTVRTYLRAITSIKNEKNNLIVSTGFAVIRPKKEFDSNFASYLLGASYFIETVVAKSVGISYPAINSSELVTIKSILPPLKEQTKIANYLDQKTKKIDTLIDKSTQAIALLKERRVALVSAVVGGKVDVRE